MCMFILLIVVATTRKGEACSPRALNASGKVPNTLSSKWWWQGRSGGGEERRRWLDSEDYQGSKQLYTLPIASA